MTLSPEEDRKLAQPRYAFGSDRRMVRDDVLDRPVSPIVELDVHVVHVGDTIRTHGKVAKLVVYAHFLRKKE